MKSLGKETPDMVEVEVHDLEGNACTDDTSLLFVESCKDLVIEFLEFVASCKGMNPEVR